MANPGRRLPGTDLVRLVHRAALDLGLPAGTPVPRELFEDLIINAFGVGSRQSIQAYIRIGQGLPVWTVWEAHGKGGRGTITLLEATHEA